MSETNKEVDNNINQNGSDDYEFVTETIKRRPVNKRKIVKKLFFTLFLAVLFGIVACVTFVLVYPKVKEKLDPDDGTVAVILPVEKDIEDSEELPPLSVDEEIVSANDESKDEGKTESSESDIVEDDSDENSGDTEDTDKKDETSADDNESLEKSSEEGKKDDEVTETAEKTQDTVSDDEQQKDGSEGELLADDDVLPEEESKEEDPFESIRRDLELDDYRALLRKISSVAEKTQKSLVTVSGFYSETDWFNNAYESNDSTIGLIVADNGKELLIVSSTNIFKNAINVKVTFVDGQTYPAKIKKSDRNTGLCVVGVELSKISEQTMKAVEKAEFGGLATSAVGVPVIAVGAPYGTSGSYGMGQITSNSVILGKTDENVGIISTDIYGSTAASGVLVNYNGRIVGIICHEVMTGDMPNLLRAYAVTDISDTIEKLSNGQELAKLGIVGTDVTEDANERLGVPFGTYIKEVVPDSPAMNVGLRNGDVIVKVGTTEIDSFAGYKAAILKCHPMDVVVITVMRPGMEEYTEVTYEVTLEAL